MITLIALSPPLWAGPPPGASKAFDRYAAQLEGRLAQRHRPECGFVSGDLPAQTRGRLRQGELILEDLATVEPADAPGAVLHHWRGTAFVAGATSADFERLMKNFDAYPQIFASRVVQAKILTPYPGPIPDRFSASMRVREKHVITVVMDMNYDIEFGRLGLHRGYSASRSTSIAEIAAPGTSREHALPAAQEHGFLWRLNTYWTYEEHDDGLYMQIQSISLTRAIPLGLGWAIRPYVESVPRGSLEFTLRTTCQALKNQQPKPTRKRKERK